MFTSERSWAATATPAQGLRDRGARTARCGPKGRGGLGLALLRAADGIPAAPRPLPSDAHTGVQEAEVRPPVGQGAAPSPGPTWRRRDRPPARTCCPLTPSSQTPGGARLVRPEPQKPRTPVYGAGRPPALVPRSPLLTCWGARLPVSGGRACRPRRPRPRPLPPRPPSGPPGPAAAGGTRG